MARLRTSTMKYSIVNALPVLACLPTTLSSPLRSRQYSPGMVYDFKELTPSPDLNWTPCFDRFTCTLLTVPLDYTDEAIGTTNIAFIKWTTNATSTNTSTAPHDILLNPGGPGGSGVQFLITSIELMQLTLGSQNNLVSFDPRGVNNSGPDLSCFPGRHGTRLLYDDELGVATDANNPKALGETWARAGAWGEWCTKAHSSGNSTAKYANTVATATDMLHYTKLLAKSKNEDPEKSQLWYYGASYGTVLGSTFAALFPNRVGRLILDGVVDAEDYYEGRWSANLADGDASVESFFTYCYEAGSSRCAFWADSAEAIKTRYNTVINQFKQRPVIVANPVAQDYPEIVTYDDYKALLLQAPYVPTIWFPLLAQFLVALEKGDISSIAGELGVGKRYESCSPNLPDVGDFEELPWIACMDANRRYNLTDFSHWTSHVNALVNQSQYLGEAWAPLVSVNCRSLDISPPSSQVFTGTPSAPQTSNPILFVSNTIDPVTPLRAAQKMTKLFGGARLLVQDAVGHSSLAVASKCTWGVLAEYIRDGTLPPEGTVCEADEVPFLSSGNGTTLSDGMKIRKRGLFV